MGIRKKGDLRLRECLSGNGIGAGVETTGRHRTLYLPIFSRDGLGKKVQEILDYRVMSWLIFTIQHL